VWNFSAHIQKRIKISDKFLLVVVNHITSTLITTRKMRKKEKLAYIEEINNEKNNK